MVKVKELSVGKQVTLTFGVLCLILLTIGGLFFFSLRSIQSKNQLQQTRALYKLALIDDIAQDVGQMQSSVLQEILANDPGEIKNNDQEVHDLEKINAKELADYQKLTDTEGEKQLYDKVVQARKAYWELTDSVLVFARANKDDEARELVNPTQDKAYDAYLNATQELASRVETEAKGTAEETTRSFPKSELSAMLWQVLPSSSRLERAFPWSESPAG